MVKLAATLTLGGLDGGAVIQFAKCDDGCLDLDLEAGTVTVRLKIYDASGPGGTAGALVRTYTFGPVAVPPAALAALRQALQTKCETLAGQAPGSSSWV